MADAAFVDVWSSDMSTDAQRVFNPSPFVQYGLALEPISFSAARSGATVIVGAARALRSLAATTITSNYAITGPSAITVTSISFTPGNTSVTINVTGTFTSGTYTLTLASQTIQALNDDQYNITTGVAFSGNSVTLKSSGFNPGFN
jgi:hypothetical protein